jgi:hypothetical protein
MAYNRFSVLIRPKVIEQELDVIAMDKTSITSLDNDTGEISSFDKHTNKLLPAEGQSLADRYSLQSVARNCLSQFRVSKCTRLPISKLNHISLYKNDALNSVFFGNLQTCGSVWHCPVCAAKISERRASEVMIAFNYFKSDSRHVISFVTRTVPHTYADSLEKILKQFRNAEKRLKADRNYQSLLKTYGVVGSIKVFEITVGLNGWHLHIHEILFSFLDTPIQGFYASLQELMYPYWSNAAVYAGFDEPSKANGLQVQNGDFAAEYIAKFGKEPNGSWDVSKELTKQHIKKSRSGFSPFDLLRLYRDLPLSDTLSIIQEYGQVMHGQKQLIWSRGLKNLIQLDEKTDDEIAKEIEAEAVLLGLLSQSQWKFILKHDLRVTILLLAKRGSFADLSVFLSAQGAPDFENT